MDSQHAALEEHQRCHWGLFFQAPVQITRVSFQGSSVQWKGDVKTEGIWIQGDFFGKFSDWRDHEYEHIPSTCLQCVYNILTICNGLHTDTQSLQADTVHAHRIVVWQAMVYLLRGIADEALCWFNEMHDGAYLIEDPMPAISRLWEEYNSWCYMITRPTLSTLMLHEVDVAGLSLLQRMWEVFPYKHGPEGNEGGWHIMKAHDMAYHFTDSVRLFGQIQVQFVFSMILEISFFVWCSSRLRWLLLQVHDFGRCYILDIFWHYYAYMYGIFVAYRTRLVKQGNLVMWCTPKFLQTSQTDMKDGRNRCWKASRTSMPQNSLTVSYKLDLRHVKWTRRDLCGQMRTSHSHQPDRQQIGNGSQAERKSPPGLLSLQWPRGTQRWSEHLVLAGRRIEVCMKFLYDTLPCPPTNGLSGCQVPWSAFWRNWLLICTMSNIGHWAWGWVEHPSYLWYNIDNLLLAYYLHMSDIR